MPCGLTRKRRSDETAMSSIAELKQPPFADFLGIKLTHVSPERVTAELLVRDEIATMPAIIHGGAVMALADNVGAVGTVVNLPEGAGTTTIESKTNFFAAIPVGETAYAESTPLHRGRTTMVWQTKITRADGRLCALVTQTQLVLQPKKD
jgi:1,4-dihydroxy-2-naphthoyl-CoA hydrolase